MFGRAKYSEIKLYDSTKERNILEQLADLYTIIRATEALEAAYSRDVIDTGDYTDSCKRLIGQFKTTEAALLSSKAIINVDSFIREYQLDCPRAIERLIVSGVPATVLHAPVDNRTDAVVVALTVQSFITAMDALKLGQKAVDEIQPLISDLTSSLGKVNTLNSTFDGITKMRVWLQKLNEMRAVAELDESDVRQLLHDLDSSYTAFHEHLSTKK
eukprot:gene6419-8836_t